MQSLLRFQNWNVSSVSNFHGPEISDTMSHQTFCFYWKYEIRKKRNYLFVKTKYKKSGRLRVMCLFSNILCHTFQQKIVILCASRSLNFAYFSPGAMRKKRQNFTHELDTSSFNFANKKVKTNFSFQNLLRIKLMNLPFVFLLRAFKKIGDFRNIEKLRLQNFGGKKQRSAFKNFKLTFPKDRCENSKNLKSGSADDFIKIFTKKQLRQFHFFFFFWNFIEQEKLFIASRFEVRSYCILFAGKIYHLNGLEIRPSFIELLSVFYAQYRASHLYHYSSARASERCCSISYIKMRKLKSYTSGSYLCNIVLRLISCRALLHQWYLYYILQALASWNVEN